MNWKQEEEKISEEPYLIKRQANKVLSLIFISSNKISPSPPNLLKERP
jgi:hypothetical protein